MPLEVLDQAPALDVLEDDAELVVDGVEIEDAADVLVVEDGVSSRLVHEHAEVAGIVGLPELLHHDRALETGLPDEQTLVDLAHAAGPELLEHLVLGRLHGKGEGRAKHGRALRGSQGTAARPRWPLA